MDIRDGLVEVVENQRFWGVLWGPPLLPGFDWPAWSDAKGQPVQLERPPEIDGQGGWFVVRLATTDEDGWLYGSGFDRLSLPRPGGRASKRMNDHVRSRVWRRLHGDLELMGKEDMARAVSTATAAATASHAQVSAQVSSSQILSALTSNIIFNKLPKPSVFRMWQLLMELWNVSAKRHGVLKIVPLDPVGLYLAMRQHTRFAITSRRAAITNGRIMLVAPWAPERTAAASPDGAAKAGSEAHAARATSQDIMMTPLKGDGAAGLSSKQLAALGKGISGQAVEGVSVAVLRPSQVSEGPAHSPLHPHASGHHHSTLLITARSKGDAVPPETGRATAAGQRANPEPTAQFLLSPSVAAAQQRRHSRSATPDQGREDTAAGKAPSPSRRWPWRLGRNSPSPPPTSSATGMRPVPFASPSTRFRGGQAGGLLPDINDLPVLLDELITITNYTRAAYGYVMAAGHMATLTTMLQMVSKAAFFNPIAGASIEANNEAIHALTGIPTSDILMAEWRNHVFRPCHYLAVDRAHRRLVLCTRGSLELGDICTDLAAAPDPFEFGGELGKCNVHQGLISAAVYVEQSTREALYAAAEAYPDWPILMTGHSLGAGVAALMTLMTRHGHGTGARPAPFAARTYCIGVACPPVVSLHVAEACSSYIISLLHDMDFVPRLSHYSVELALMDMVRSSPAAQLADQLNSTLATMHATITGKTTMERQGGANPVSHSTSQANLAGGDGSGDTLPGSVAGASGGAGAGAEAGAAPPSTSVAPVEIELITQRNPYTAVQAHMKQSRSNASLAMLQQGACASMGSHSVPVGATGLNTNSRSTSSNGAAAGPSGTGSGASGAAGGSSGAESNTQLAAGHQRSKSMLAGSAATPSLVSWQSFARPAAALTAWLGYKAQPSNIGGLDGRDDGESGQTRRALGAAGAGGSGGQQPGSGMGAEGGEVDLMGCWSDMVEAVTGEAEGARDSWLLSPGPWGLGSSTDDGARMRSGDGAPGSSSMYPRQGDRGYGDEQGSTLAAVAAAGRQLPDAALTAHAGASTADPLQPPTGQALHPLHPSATPPMLRADGEGSSIGEQGRGRGTRVAPGSSSQGDAQQMSTATGTSVVARPHTGGTTGAIADAMEDLQSAAEEKAGPTAPITALTQEEVQDRLRPTKLYVPGRVLWMVYEAESAVQAVLQQPPNDAQPQETTRAAGSHPQAGSTSVELVLPSPGVRSAGAAQAELSQPSRVARMAPDSDAGARSHPLAPTPRRMSEAGAEYDDMNDSDLEALQQSYHMLELVIAQDFVPSVLGAPGRTQPQGAAGTQAVGDRAADMGGSTAGGSKAGDAVASTSSAGTPAGMQSRAPHRDAAAVMAEAVGMLPPPGPDGSQPADGAQPDRKEGEGQGDGGLSQALTEGLRKLRANMEAVMSKAVLGDWNGHGGQEGGERTGGGGSGAGAGGEEEGGTDGPRVVCLLEPDRRMFEQLALIPSCAGDHLPDSYYNALLKLREALQLKEAAAGSGSSAGNSPTGSGVVSPDQVPGVLAAAEQAAAGGASSAALTHQTVPGGPPIDRIEARGDAGGGGGWLGARLWRIG